MHYIPIKSEKLPILAPKMVSISKENRFVLTNAHLFFLGGHISFVKHTRFDILPTLKNIGHFYHHFLLIYIFFMQDKKHINQNLDFYEEIYIIFSVTIRFRPHVIKVYCCCAKNRRKIAFHFIKSNKWPIRL